MKKWCILTITQFFAGIILAQGFTETLIFENQDLHIVLQCKDTASTDQADWMKLIIKNKTSSSIFISEAEYAIHEKMVQPDGRSYLDYGRYGQANKYDLFHYYYDLAPSDNRKSPELRPSEALSSWKYLVNYTSVLIEPRTGNSAALLCPLFQFKLTYKINNESKKIENEGAPFCFYWIPDAQIPEAKLVQRLKNVLQDAHFRWANTYIINHLMGKPAIVRQVSSDEFVEAVLLRKQSMVNDENILFLNELQLRNAIPDSRLTERYRADLKAPTNATLEELLYYWDNDLLEDLLHGSNNVKRVCRTLEASANQWSLIPENKGIVYDYLSKNLFYAQTMPTDSNFEHWSNAVKLMSISRDQRVIDYLVPLLDNEQTFSIKDWSKYSRMDMRPSDAQPDLRSVRVCDVAFVSLLRAIGQTDYRIDARLGTKYFGMVFKKGVLDKEAVFVDEFMVRNIDYDLFMAEKSIKMTAQSKEDIKKYIQSMK